MFTEGNICMCAAGAFSICFLIETISEITHRTWKNMTHPQIKPRSPTDIYRLANSIPSHLFVPRVFLKDNWADYECRPLLLCKTTKGQASDIIKDMSCLPSCPLGGAIEARTHVKTVFKCLVHWSAELATDMCDIDFSLLRTFV